MRKNENSSSFLLTDRKLNAIISLSQPNPINMKYDSIIVRFNTPVNRQLVISEKEGYTAIWIPFIGSYWSGLSGLIDDLVNQEADMYELEDSTDMDEYELPFDYEALCKKIATYTCEELLGLSSDGEWEFIGVDMPGCYNYGDDNLWVYIRNDKMDELKEEFGGDFQDEDFKNSPICKKLIKELTPWGGINRDLDYSIEQRGYDRGIGGEIFSKMYNDDSGWCIQSLIEMSKLVEA